MTMLRAVRQYPATLEATVSKSLNGNAYYMKLRRRKCDTGFRRAQQCPVSRPGSVAALRVVREGASWGGERVVYRTRRSERGPSIVDARARQAVTS